MDYHGWWNDGQSARRDAVRVRLFGRRLLISDRDSHQTLAELSLDGLTLAEEVYAGQPLRLKHADQPDARLTVDDHALMDKLCAAEPRLGGRYHARHGTMYRAMVWCSALVGTLAVLLGIVQFGAEPLAAMVPLEWEESLGKRTMASFVDEYGTCDGGPGATHLQALVGELAAHATARYRFRVHVLRGEEVNAFALPGGHIAVFHGLLQKAGGPNEAAGVLAHEIAHVALRHPMEQLLRRSGYSLLASVVTGDLSGFAALAGDAAALVASMANSRADEAEADRVAVPLLNSAGIDSRGLPRFFEKLQRAGESLPAALSLVSTHPANAARIRETRSLAAEGRAALTETQWEAARRSCAIEIPR